MTLKKDAPTADLEIGKIAVIASLDNGPQSLAQSTGNSLVLIAGVQVIEDPIAVKAFTVSEIGDLMSIAEFVGQPLAVIRRQLKPGLTVEARTLLLEQSLKPALRKELESIEP